MCVLTHVCVCLLFSDVRSLCSYVSLSGDLCGVAVCLLTYLWSSGVMCQ